LAEAKSLPLVPFTFLGGAAHRAFARRDWKHLNPGFDASILEKEHGIDHTIEIANRMIIDRVARVSGRSAQKLKRVFLSFAHHDSAMASAMKSFLLDRGVEVLVGDDEIRADQMIAASIEQALLTSDVCAVLWSRNYALSPWCFDELSLAMNQQLQGRMNVWLLNLDDSPVVPTQARKLAAISVRSREAIERVIGELLDVKSATAHNP
jgi:TIR domain